MIRNIQNIQDDMIKAKREIKNKLINDPDIIEALHNPKLSPDEPDLYLQSHIYDYIRVPGTTSEKKNFICFDIKQQNTLQTNKYMKQNTYVFSIFVPEDDIVTNYGMARHDLLAYLIRDIFNFSNFAGTQLVLYQNNPGIADAVWNSRTMYFREYAPNSPYKAVTTNRAEYGN